MKEEIINIEDIEKEIVSTLKDFDIEKIILFGSYVYGKANIDSDLDICIVKKEIKSKIEEKRKIRKALKHINIAKDILVVDEKYFYKHSGKDWINTALYDIRKKGKILYEKRRDNK